MGLSAEQPDDLSPRNKEAADTALELMKQLITLSSGVLALGAAFLDKFRIDSRVEYALLALAWALLIVAIATALDTISAIVKSHLTPEHRWHTGRGQMAARISKWAFVLGITCFGIFALVTTLSSDTKADEPAQWCLKRR